MELRQSCDSMNMEFFSRHHVRDVFISLDG